MGELRIVSRSSEPFEDRQEAGRLLASEFRQYSGQKAVILGIPRGGVIVARALAHGLGAELDIVLARKLRTPGHAELAMGSVAEDGKVFLNQEVIQDLGIDEAYIQQEKEQQMVEIRRRAELIRSVRPKVTLDGRTVIVTDDGVATGATTRAALWAVKLEHPRKLIAALPVGPVVRVTELAEEVDELICLRAPPLFAAVGQFYEQFEPVEDEEVLRILGEEKKRASRK